MPPSDSPISAREATSITNEDATAEPIELIEKTTMHATSTLLRRPVASENALTPNADSAQVSDSADASIPIWVFESPRSFATNGAR